jgi:hypothetical protein
MEEDRRRVDAEIRHYGEDTVTAFYGALGQLDHYRRWGVRFRAAAQHGRARRAAPARARGSRRTTSTRGSPGDDPPDGQSDPESERVCGCGCGESIAHLASQARYLNEAHSKRAERARKQPAETRTTIERAGWRSLARDAARADEPEDTFGFFADLMVEDTDGLPFQQPRKHGRRVRVAA